MGNIGGMGFVVCSGALAHRSSTMGIAEKSALTIEKFGVYNVVGSKGECMFRRNLSIGGGRCSTISLKGSEGEREKISEHYACACILNVRVHE